MLKIQNTNAFRQSEYSLATQFVLQRRAEATRQTVEKEIVTGNAIGIFRADALSPI